MSRPNFALVGTTVQAKLGMTLWTVKVRAFTACTRFKDEDKITMLGRTATGRARFRGGFLFKASHTGLGSIFRKGFLVVAQKVLDFAGRELGLAFGVRTFD